GVQAGTGLLPLTAGEVGDLHQAAAVEGRLGQRYGGAPRGGVVHVDVGHQPLPHALHEAVDQDVVHPAVAAVVLRGVTDVLPQPMVVLVQVGLGVLPLVVAVLGFEVDPRGIVLQHAPRTGECVDPAVRTRGRDIVDGPDQPALLGGDHAGDPVPGDILLVPHLGPVRIDIALAIVGEAP